MSKGWIKLHRQIQDCSIWQDGEPFSRGQAWVDLLLLANHRDKQIIFNGKPLTIKRGQYLTSVRKLAERWDWSNDRTLRYLRMIEDLGMISKDSDNHRTLLTIENYEVFQGDCDTDEDTGKDTNKDTDKSQTRIKELKNVKNEKNEKKIYYPNDSALNEAFEEYISMRKKIKKPLTSDHAIDLAMRKLENLSFGDNDLAIEILNQSILNSWQGLFEIKGRNNNKIDWDKV